ncbi:hypothetical protein ZWY2020_057966 [Hordeum vulgare]|nr:hypothetical protein ZWY2020_057966 [Hordeum vulgare]
MAPAGYSSSCPYIHSDLILCIAATGRLSLRDYASLRAVCTEWRSALASLSPYPCLLSLRPEGDGDHSASVFSLPLQCSFHLHTGSSLIDGKHNAKTSSVRAPPSSAVTTAGPLGPARAGSPAVWSRIPRPPSLSVWSGLDHRQPIRTAARSGTRPDWTVTAADDHGPIHGHARLVGSGNGRFAIAVDQRGTGYKPVDGGSAAFPISTRRIFLVDPRVGKVVDLVSPTEEHDTVRKIVFAPNKTNDDWTVAAVYKRSTKVAHMDGKLDEKWTLVAKNMEHIADLALYNGADGKLYCGCLSTTGSVHVFRIIANGGQGYKLQPPVWNMDAVDAFASPYDTISTLTSTKQLFFWHGTMYQVWQNNGCTVKLRVGYTMSDDEIFLLRCAYDPDGRQRWDIVKDLGGYSVFISTDGSPVVVQPAAFPEMRGDCVYWINSPSRVPMVCDIATGTSKPWLLPLPYGACCKADCWYFGDDHPHDDDDEAVPSTSSVP